MPERRPISSLRREIGKKSPKIDFWPHRENGKKSPNNRQTARNPIFGLFFPFLGDAFPYFPGEAKIDFWAIFSDFGPPARNRPSPQTHKLARIVGLHAPFINRRRAEYGFGEYALNTELSEFCGPHQVPGRTLSEFLSACYNSCTQLDFFVFFPQNSVSSLVRNSTFETVFRPFPFFSFGGITCQWPRTTFT